MLGPLERAPAGPMSNHDKDQVLAVLKYYLPQDLRRKVMLEVPRAYNAWMGAEYVRVHRVSDGDPLEPVVDAVVVDGDQDGRA
jgi:hypothetical protein